ncbi:Nucleolar protein 16 [Basidiobolus ranarum]|uniref:Nucleolar protein 16 n=1 Tax=Basidiobolus ranarum TaxID=34480 RepID=A0ABR2W4L4_9FUNG
MARPRKRKTQASGSKLTRKTQNKHFKRAPLVNNKIISENWDRKATLRQNYQRLGLMTTLNKATGGLEYNEEEEEASEVDLDKLSPEEISRHLGPGQGLIERDEEGNVINIIVGKDPNEFDSDEEFPSVPAKTDVVRALEEQAANGLKIERHQSQGEVRWIQELIDKHGDDYDGMFRDRKLNVNQQTASQLRKKCQAYLKKNKQ